MTRTELFLLIAFWLITTGLLPDAWINRYLRSLTGRGLTQETSKPPEVLITHSKYRRLRRKWNKQKGVL